MIIAIVGATSTGKSELSLFLAKALGAEIINADAYQVYQGMDIGTAKLSPFERRGVPHHLIDIVSAKETFDVAQYQKLARHILDQKNRPPMILVGGSGFYLKSVLHDFNFPDRKPLSSENALSNEQLYQRLQDLDPKSLDKIHINNRKRLLNAYRRALSDQPMSHHTNHNVPRYDYHIIGLESARDQLYQAIDLRVEKMIEKGLKKEAQRLLENQMSVTATEAIGYKEWIPYFAGQINESEVILAIKQNTRRYAKRQISYFKHQFDVHWFAKDTDFQEILKALPGIPPIKRS